MTDPRVPAEPPRRPAPPEGYADPSLPRHRRYWGYYNRPYGGCGCLYTILVLALLWILLRLIFLAPTTSALLLGYG